MFQWMHGSIAMKESSEPDQPGLSHVWHSHDCGFNSALSGRSAGSRIMGNSVVVVYGGCTWQIQPTRIPQRLAVLLVGLHWWLRVLRGS
jgi:hypothetical protein